MLSLVVLGCTGTDGTGGGGPGEGGAAGVGGEAGAGGQGGTGGDRPWLSAASEEADVHCQAFCAAGCDFPRGCYERCRHHLAVVCGVHNLYLGECAIEAACDHSDCGEFQTAFNLCRNEILLACRACAEGTLCHDNACGCIEMGGDCNATVREGACRVAVDSGECADLATCSVRVGQDVQPCIGEVPACLEPEEGRPPCANGEVDPIAPCCELEPPPEQPDACEGDESIENPTSCTGDGSTVTYLLSQLEVLDDCNIGYDLDGCFGQSCIVGGLVQPDGELGVDNGLGALAIVTEGIGSNIAQFNQIFADAICGKTQPPGSDSCNEDVPLLELRLSVETDASEGCAKVAVSSGTTLLGAVPMNLSEAGCLSGRLPPLPMQLDGWDAELSNVALRTTISETGFSHGVMGATGGQWLDYMIDGLFGAGMTIGQSYDINADLEGNNEAGCNAVSGTYRVGGLVEP